jgi:hypothetical protein
MLTKVPSDVRSFHFDFSNILSPSDIIVKIHDAFTDSDSVYVDGQVFVDRQGVSINIGGGVVGDSCQVSVLVKTEQDDILEIKEILVVESFDFDARLH